jgi:hypothetical protein
MRSSRMTGQRLAAICVMGCVLLNYPILSLFSRPEDVMGIPLLYVYVFAVWILLVGLLALVIERPRA